jgi:hypothetical protein
VKKSSQNAQFPVDSKGVECHTTDWDNEWSKRGEPVLVAAAGIRPPKGIRNRFP